MGAPIRSIAVVGGGIAAWTAAAVLAQALPGVAIGIVNHATPDPDPDDCHVALRPAQRRRLAQIGLDDRTLAARAGGVLRLGHRIDGWGGPGSAFVQGFGRYGAGLDGVPFPALWLRSLVLGERVPFAAYSTGAMLAAAGWFTLPGRVPPPCDAFDYGWDLEPVAYRDTLRALAHASGVRRIDAPLAGVVRDAPDRIAHLALAEGGSVTADLYVDCTGPAAILLTALNGGAAWQSWSRWLPCDRIAVAAAPAAEPLPLVDRAVAQPSGWRLEAPLGGWTTIVSVAASTFGAVAEAAIPLRQGRRVRSWIGNCVAVGSASVQLEPLGAPTAQLLLGAIDRIVAMLPGTDYATVELNEYDRVAARDADRIRDFVILHHATARRPEPFWRTIGESALPDDLAETLSTFRERGLVPGREGETQPLDAWAAVLFGQGVVPHRADPFAEAVAPDRILAATRGLRERIAAAVATAVPHRQWLDSLRTAA